MTSLRVTAAALVVIAAATLWSTVRTELLLFGIDLGVGGHFGYAPLSDGGFEVSSEVVDTSYHFRGEPGESEIVTLDVGVWEVLGGSEDAPIELASVDRPLVAGWTGFNQVVTVVDADWDTVVNADSAGHVFPYGPMRLTVDADRPWVVDVRRVLCPSDVHQP